MSRSTSLPIWISTPTSDEVVVIKSFDHTVGALVEAGEPDQPVRVDGIRRAPDTVEGEIDLHRLADVGDRHVDAPDPRFAAELADQVGGAVDAFRREVRVEQERPPRQADLRARTQGDGAFELALADVAPRTPRIEDHLDVHAASRPLLTIGDGRHRLADCCLALARAEPPIKQPKVERALK